MDVTKDRRRKSQESRDAIGQRILAAILVEAVSHAPYSEMDDDWAGPVIVDFRRKGVRYAPARWFGQTSVALRQACSRAVRRMARDGLLECVTDLSRVRVRFVRPTAAGVRQAGASCDVADLRQSLAQSSWGKSVIDDLEAASGADRTQQAA